MKVVPDQNESAELSRQEQVMSELLDDAATWFEDKEDKKIAENIINQSGDDVSSLSLDALKSFEDSIELKIGHYSEQYNEWDSNAPTEKELEDVLQTVREEIQRERDLHEQTVDSNREIIEKNREDSKEVLRGVSEQAEALGTEAFLEKVWEAIQEEVDRESSEQTLVNLKQMDAESEIAGGVFKISEMKNSQMTSEQIMSGHHDEISMALVERFKKDPEFKNNSSFYDKDAGEFREGFESKIKFLCKKYLEAEEGTKSIQIPVRKTNEIPTPEPEAPTPLESVANSLAEEVDSEFDTLEKGPEDLFAEFAKQGESHEVYKFFEKIYNGSENIPQTLKLVFLPGRNTDLEDYSAHRALHIDKFRAEIAEKIASSSEMQKALGNHQGGEISEMKKLAQVIELIPYLGRSGETDLPAENTFGATPEEQKEFKTIFDQLSSAEPNQDFYKSALDGASAFVFRKDGGVDYQTGKSAGEEKPPYIVGLDQGDPLTPTQLSKAADYVAKYNPESAKVVEMEYGPALDRYAEKFLESKGKTADEIALMKENGFDDFIDFKATYLSYCHNQTLLLKLKTPPADMLAGGQSERKEEADAPTTSLSDCETSSRPHRSFAFHLLQPDGDALRIRNGEVKDGDKELNAPKMENVIFEAKINGKWEDVTNQKEFVDFDKKSGLGTIATDVEVRVSYEDGGNNFEMHTLDQSEFAFQKEDGAYRKDLKYEDFLAASKNLESQYDPGDECGLEVSKEPIGFYIKDIEVYAQYELDQVGDGDGCTDCKTDANPGDKPGTGSSQI